MKSEPWDVTKFQVLICASRVTIPLCFALHPWVLINDHGAITRWEVLHTQVGNGEHWRYLHRNALPPLKGLGVFWHSKRWYMPAKRLFVIEDEPAIALAKIINRSPELYPYTNEYHFVGPNSNTYAQWALDQIPNNTLQLPWNSFGKNYKL